MLEQFDGSTDPDSINFWNANWIMIFPEGNKQYMHGTYKLASTKLSSTE